MAIDAQKIYINGKRYYLLGNKKFPSVTTIISETMPVSKRCALSNWRKSLGSDRAKIQQDIKDRGTNFHKILELILMDETDLANKELVKHPEVKDFLFSGKKLISQIMLGVPVLSETQVFSKKYQYAGTIDLMGRYFSSPCTGITATGQGREVLFDWKTSNKLKTKDSCEDYLIQLAAYANALYETYGITVDSASVCIFYQDTSPDVFKLGQSDIGVYFDKFLFRLAEFQSKKTLMSDDSFASLCAHI